MSDRRLAAVPAAEEAAPADPAAVFTAERRRLVGLAYRITGSLTDADDVVQEAWLRFQRTGPETVERPAAWLTTVVARLALDHLKAARHQREVVSAIGSEVLSWRTIVNPVRYWRVVTGGE
jgi:DNA-directed RNA polymerase specialized sigma24 family protein